MSFDKAWFDELRNITQNKIDIVQKNINITQAKKFKIRPRVCMLHEYKYISFNFLRVTDELINSINNKGYKFDADGFKCYAKHIFTFTQWRAYRKQWNIGFTSNSNPDEDYARIGIGFFINTEFNPMGLPEYRDFMNLVKQRPDEFDRTFDILGNYAELPFPRSQEKLSSLIPEYHPDPQGDWIFFGKRIQRNSAEGQEILNSIDRFVQEAVSVFDHIRSSGFGL